MSGEFNKPKERQRPWAIAAAGALVVGSIVGYIYDRHLASNSRGAQLAAIYVAASRCTPSGVEQNMKDVVVDKVFLPTDPTDLDIAGRIAQQVPGALACDGNRGLASFIALEEVLNAPSANSIESLKQLVAQQPSQNALLVAPVAVSAWPTQQG